MTQLKLDPRNARRHSDRNKRQIKRSLETVGAGRSILADADGIVRAGNGVFAEWGDKPIKIVETDGKELVVVQRTDLRGQDAVRAAALDNLVADSSAFDYDAAILAEIARDDDVIRAIANEDAKLRMLLEIAAPPTLDELEQQYGEPGERDFWPWVRVQVSPETNEKYKALMETLPGADEAEKFDALVSRGN